MNKQEKMIIILSAIVIGFAAFLYAYLPSIMLSLKPQNNNFIGLALKVQGDVKMRFGDSVSWQEIKNNEKIYTRSYLYTGEDSSAHYAFIDQSTITLGPNSLIFIDFVMDKRIDDSKKAEGSGQTEQPLAIDLVDGQMDINLKENSPVKKLKVDDAEIDISDQKTTLKLSNNDKEGMEISVMQGDIGISKDNKKYSVKSGEKLGVAKDDSAPVKSQVSKEVMDEMSKIVEQEKNQLAEDIKKRREFSYIMREIFLFFRDALLPQN